MHTGSCPVLGGVHLYKGMLPRNASLPWFVIFGVFGRAVGDMASRVPVLWPHIPNVATVSHTSNMYPNLFGLDIVCTCTFIDIHMHIHLHIHIHIHLYIYIHVCRGVYCSYIHIYKHMYPYYVRGVLASYGPRSEQRPGGVMLPWLQARRGDGGGPWRD